MIYTALPLLVQSGAFSVALPNSWNWFDVTCSGSHSIKTNYRAFYYPYMLVGISFLYVPCVTFLVHSSQSSTDHCSLPAALLLHVQPAQEDAQSEAEAGQARRVTCHLSLLGGQSTKYPHCLNAQ